jgi:hypothetical protein
MNDHLTRLEPKGIWKAPLSEEQVAQAITFGLQSYPDEKSLERDPYDSWVEDAKIFITFGTAFGRIAAYAGAQKRKTEELDNDIIKTINNNPTFVAGYFTIRLLSTSRFTSVLRYTFDADSPGGCRDYIKMAQKVCRKNGDTWHLSGAFPNPAPLYSYANFELGIPQFFVFNWRILKTGVAFEYLH